VAITGLSLFAMLRTRMQWHQERQRVLAENVANANTPGFRPHDLAPLRFDRTQPQTASLGLMQTEPGHIAASGSASSRFQTSRFGGYEIRPSGNAVNLEDEMIKVAANQMDYQAATTLYTRSLGLIKTAIGKR
jgi:flagellar basal-body rod protein FlgB